MKKRKLKVKDKFDYESNSEHSEVGSMIFVLLLVLIGVATFLVTLSMLGPLALLLLVPVSIIALIIVGMKDW